MHRCEDSRSDEHAQLVRSVVHACNRSGSAEVPSRVGRRGNAASVSKGGLNECVTQVSVPPK